MDHDRERELEKMENDLRESEKQDKKQGKVIVIGIIAFIYLNIDPLFMPSFITMIVMLIFVVCVLYLLINLLISLWKNGY